MASPIVTPTSDLSQQAYEFVTINGRDVIKPFLELLEKLNITGDAAQSLIDECCDIGQQSFLTGYQMADAMRHISAFGGD